MKSGLEQFVQDHREEFDDEVPAPKIWENAITYSTTRSHKRPAHPISHQNSNAGSRQQRHNKIENFL